MIMIRVNNKSVSFDDSERFRTASMIKARAGADLQYYLMKEMPSDVPDKFVGDNETIEISDNDSFWLVPPCF